LWQEVGLSVVAVNQDRDLVPCRELFIWHIFFFLGDLVGSIYYFDTIISAFSSELIPDRFEEVIIGGYWDFPPPA
jgi:hypothetical protein